VVRKGSGIRCRVLVHNEESLSPSWCCEAIMNESQGEESGLLERMWDEYLNSRLQVVRFVSFIGMTAMFWCRSVP
jgi:hypothetical protein